MWLIIEQTILLIQMAQFSYTVTPSISENPVTGEETYHVMDADVSNSGMKEAANQQSTRQQQENYVEDEEGNLHYEQQASESDLTNLIESVVGDEAYSAALDWAQYSLPEDDIEAYDEMMSSGDLNGIASYMGQLMERYENRSEDVDEADEFSSYIFDNVCSPQEYGEIADWVRSNLSAEEVDTYNAIVDGKDLESLIPLIEQIQQHLANNDWIKTKLPWGSSSNQRA